MKIVVTLFASIFVSLSGLQAQPILDNTVFPTIGDTVNFISLSDGQGILPGAAGSNVTWDFSNLNLTGSNFSITYLDPSSTGNANLFPEANLAKYYSANQIEYYNKTSDSLYFYGDATTGVGLRYYHNPRLNIKAPFNFGESFSDDFASNFVNGSGFSVTRTGTVQSTLDGYGTLILPNITIPNCIRIKIARYVHDIQGSTVYNTNDTLYYWYAPSIRDYIIYYYSTTISGTQYSFGNVRNYLDINSISELNNGYDPINIFPNPASETLTISLPENATTTECILVDNLGKEMKRFSVSGGENLVDVSELENGVYLMRIGSVTQKIIIE
jgi:hypothetical protein